MNQFARCFLALLFLTEATLATANAQGRGGPNGGPGRMTRSAPARAGAAPAPRSSGNATQPSAAKHVTAPPSQIVVRPQRHVIIPPLYPGLYGGIYNPYWHSSFYSGPYVSPYRDPYYSAPPPQEQNNDSELAFQMQLLIREVERLRQEQAYAEPPPPPPLPAAPPPPPSPPRAETPPTPITLVFRDGNRLSITNYAVARQTLWVMGNQPGKIALADLDLEATQRANPTRTLLLPVQTGN